jgi:hypothetical protein
MAGRRVPCRGAQRRANADPQRLAEEVAVREGRRCRAAATPTPAIGAVHGGAGRHAQGSSPASWPAVAHRRPPLTPKSFLLTTCWPDPPHRGRQPAPRSTPRRPRAGLRLLA